MTISASLISTIVLCGIFLVGCANYDYGAITAFNGNNIEYFLNYYQKIKHLSDEDLIQEYEDVKQDYVEEYDNVNALKFSLILINLDSKTDIDTEYEDTFQAVNILESLIRQSQNDSIKKLSQLLRDMLLENQKKEILYTITNKKLSDLIEEKRKQEVIQKMTKKKLSSIVKEKKKKDVEYKKIYEQLSEKEQIVEKLQKKIEELKAIERSINERKNTKAPST